MPESDGDVIYLPYVQVEDGTDSVPADGQTTETVSVDYTDQLTALANNQVMQLDSVSAALAVVVFALAAIFGAIASRGLFWW